jgi:hypothetical protein
MLKVPGSIPRSLFHFLTILLQRRKLCSRFSRFDPQITVSFFNELATEKKNMLKVAPSMKASGLCFIFKELATKKRNYAHCCPQHES